MPVFKRWGVKMKRRRRHDYYRDEYRKTDDYLKEDSWRWCGLHVVI